MWVLIVALVASAAAIAAALFSYLGWLRAGRASQSAEVASSRANEAIERSSEATRISTEQQEAASANNAMARDANSIATEALRLTRVEHDRVQRQEDELHEINWGVTWDDRPPLDEPAHVFDRRLRIIQYGPDDAHDVEVFFFVGTFRWLARAAGDMKSDARLTLFPAERTRLVNEQLSRRWKDSAGNPVTMTADSPSLIAAVDGMAYQAFHFPTKVLIRWKSAAEVTHQTSFQFRPLSEHQLGADVRFPLR